MIWKQHKQISSIKLGIEDKTGFSQKHAIKEQSEHKYELFGHF